MSPLPAVTTESALIGAFACVIAAVLLRQVTAPGRSLVWSRQATILALVPTGGRMTASTRSGSGCRRAAASRSCRSWVGSPAAAFRSQAG